MVQLTNLNGKSQSTASIGASNVVIEIEMPIWMHAEGPATVTVSGPILTYVGCFEKNAATGNIVIATSATGAKEEVSVNSHGKSVGISNCTAISPISSKAWALNSDGTCDSISDWSKVMTKGKPVPDIMCDQPCPIDASAEIGSFSEWDAQTMQQCGGQTTDAVSGVVTSYVTVFGVQEKENIIASSYTIDATPPGKIQNIEAADFLGVWSSHGSRQRF